MRRRCSSRRSAPGWRQPSACARRLRSRRSRRQLRRPSRSAPATPVRGWPPPRARSRSPAGGGRATGWRRSTRACSRRGSAPPSGRSSRPRNRRGRAASRRASAPSSSAGGRCVCTSRCCSSCRPGVRRRRGRDCRCSASCGAARAVQRLRRAVVAPPPRSPGRPARRSVARRRPTRRPRRCRRPAARLARPRRRARTRRRAQGGARGHRARRGPGPRDTLKQRFRASGLYHLLAVSGSNVAVVAGGALGLLFLLGVSRLAGRGRGDRRDRRLRARGRAAAVRDPGGDRRRARLARVALRPAARRVACAAARRGGAARLESVPRARRGLPAVVRRGAVDLRRRAADPARPRRLSAAALVPDGRRGLRRLRSRHGARCPGSSSTRSRC